MTERVSTELETRMIALVDRMAAPKWDASNVDWVAPILAEARKIKAELPSADILEARRVVVETFGDLSGYGAGPERVRAINSGEGDDYWEMRAVLAAIKRGREIAAA